MTPHTQRLPAVGPRTRRARSVPARVECLEVRRVLSAPPVIGPIPSPITVAEFGHSTGMLFTATATDPDSAPSQLTFSITQYPTRGMAFITPPGTFFYQNYDHAPYTETITIKVTDETGLSDSATFAIDVVNVPPFAWISGGSPQAALAGQPSYLHALGSDTGPDAMEAWWDFGDGTVTAPAPASPFTPNHGYWWYSASDSGTHVYARPGDYTARAFFRDQHGAMTSASVDVHVTAWRLDAATNALVVGGTPSNDVIHISPAAQGMAPDGSIVSPAVNLFLNGYHQGAFAVGQVIAYGYGGEDVLDAAADVPIPMQFYGGDGNDLLRGGMGDDLLLGEGGGDGLEGRAGDDVLVGGDAADELHGCSGRDVLIGGAGGDWLLGDDQIDPGAEDLVIAGFTDYDADRAALAEVVQAWAKSPAAYPVRVAALRSGVGPGGSVRLVRDLTVHDDGGDADWLRGYGGRDWFFAALTDKLCDRPWGAGASDEELDLLP